MFKIGVNPQFAKFSQYQKYLDLNRFRSIESKISHPLSTLEQGKSETLTYQQFSELHLDPYQKPSPQKQVGFTPDLATPQNEKEFRTDLKLSSSTESVFLPKNHTTKTHYG